MTYNILHEPWMLVRYLDGTAKRIGVRQAFIDAKQIREVLPPVMYGNKQYFAAFANLHLLAIITMAAHYKPHNKFVAKRQTIWKEQLLNGMDLKTILEYLDTYEARFDIFSETHPFLQNIKYANKVNNKDILRKKALTAKDIKYISNANPFAPSANNPMIGARRCYTSGYSYPIPLMHYQMTPAEFTQILVYSPWCASSAPGQYPVGLYSTTNIVISPLGSNLEETILRHCVEIPNSTRPSYDEPDQIYDRPRWEWDNEEECFLHPRKNMLSNAFFNGVEMLAARSLNADGFIKYIYIATTSECLHPTEKKAAIAGYPAFFRDRESSTALCYNPYTIREMSTFKDDQSIKFYASGYSIDKAASNLFLAATKQLPHEQLAHILNHNKDATCLRLYYRTYSDAYHALLDNQGILEMPAITLELLDTEKHMAATNFQNQYHKISKYLSKALRKIEVSEANVACRNREMSHLASNVFMNLIAKFKELDSLEYETIVNEYVNVIKREVRAIMEAEGRYCRSAVQYSNAWDSLLKDLYKI